MVPYNNLDTSSPLVGWLLKRLRTCANYIPSIFQEPKHIFCREKKKTEGSTGKRKTTTKKQQPFIGTHRKAPRKYIEYPIISSIHYPIQVNNKTFRPTGPSIIVCI